MYIGQSGQHVKVLAEAVEVLGTQLLVSLLGKFELLPQACDQLMLTTLQHQRVFDLAKGLQADLAVLNQPLLGQRAAAFDFGIAPLAIDQGQHQVGRQAPQPVLEQLVRALIVRRQGCRQTEPRVTRRHGNRDFRIGRAQQQVSALHIRTTTHQLGRQTSRRQSGQLCQARKLRGFDRHALLWRLAQQHREQVLQ